MKGVGLVSDGMGTGERDRSILWKVLDGFLRCFDGPLVSRWSGPRNVPDAPEVVKWCTFKDNHLWTAHKVFTTLQSVVAASGLRIHTVLPLQSCREAIKL